MPRNKKPVVLQNYAEAVDRCIPPASMVLPTCCFIGAGLALSTTMDHMFSKDGDPDNFPAGLFAATLAGITMGAGIGLTVTAVQRANRNYNYMVCRAAEERRTVEIFESIIKSSVYNSEQDFMDIVDALDGVSDADKANLRRRYQDYIQGVINAAATQQPTQAQPEPEGTEQSGK